MGKTWRIDGRLDLSDVTNLEDDYGGFGEDDKDWKLIQVRTMQIIINMMIEL